MFDTFLTKDQEAAEKRPSASLRRTPKYASGRLTNSSAWQDVAPYSSRRHSQDFGRPRKRDFAGLNLHLGIFEQPDKNYFFSRLSDYV
jgi:hypothetical protein